MKKFILALPLLTISTSEDYRASHATCYVGQTAPGNIAAVVTANETGARLLAANNFEPGSHGDLHAQYLRQYTGSNSPQLPELSASTIPNFTVNFNSQTCHVSALNLDTKTLRMSSTEIAAYPMKIVALPAPQ